MFRVFRAADDDQDPVAGPGDVQLHLPESGGGQLAGKIVALVAGQAVGGVPASSRLGEALSEY